MFSIPLSISTYTKVSPFVVILSLTKNRAPPSTSSGCAVYFCPSMLSVSKKHDKLSANGKYKQTYVYVLNKKPVITRNYKESALFSNTEYAKHSVSIDNISFLIFCILIWEQIRELLSLTALFLASLSVLLYLFIKSLSFILSFGIIRPCKASHGL